VKTPNRLTRRDLVWAIPSVITAGFFGWLGWRSYYIQFLKKPVSTPVWVSGPRMPVGSLKKFKTLWSFSYFGYPMNGGSLPAVLFRTPLPVLGGISLRGQHFIALSRVCTHMGCTVNFIDNPELGAIAYNYRTDHPFLGCPCHFGAFEPLQAGRAVYGPPSKPLPRLRLEASGHNLFVTGLESSSR
jgi:arsenite oxidase small subunit